MSGADQAAPVISRAGRGVRTSPDKQFPAGMESSGVMAPRHFEGSEGEPGYLRANSFLPA